MGKRIPSRTTSILYRVIGPVLAGMLAVTGLFTSARPVLAADELTITYVGDNLPAVVGQSWSRTYEASGGTEPYKCTLSGTIPNGLTFNTSTCKLSGTPTVFGSFENIVINFTDSSSTPKSGTATIPEMRVEAETDTTLTIRSGHPDGSTLMAGYPVWVKAKVQYQASELGDQHPTGTVTVSSGPGGPTCSIELDYGEGECALVFDSAGSKTITASYPKTEYARASSDSEPISLQPLNVPPMLSAGRNHTCYLASDGMMKCWGKTEAFPVDENDNPIEKGPYTKISSGDFQTCGLKINGAIECWGENLEVTSNVPTGVFVDISSGEEHVCAINNVNKLTCWGQADDESSALLTDFPTAKVTAVSAGSNFDCAILKSNGRATCWGQDLTEPAVAMKALAVSGTHVCGVTTNGSLSCWGGVISGLPQGDGYTAIGSGSNYSCAQKGDTLTCWGSGAPVAGVITDLSHFSSGAFHTCAVEKSGGTLSCWGSNTYQQAPRITLSSTGLPQYLPINEEFSLSITADGGNAPYTFSIVGDGLPTGLSLTSEGLLSGSLANPTNLSFTVAAAENYTPESLWPLELTPGRQTYSSTVYDTRTTTTLTLPAGPVKAGSAVAAKATVTRVNATQPPLTGSVEITSTDGEASCRAQVIDGIAECNLYFSTPGEKSVSAAFVDSDTYAGSTSDFKTITIEPVEIDPIVAAGKKFSCSIDSTGNLTCWGDYDSDKTTPPSTGGFIQMDLGESHACAVSLNRRVTCWGGNPYGAGEPLALAGFAQVAVGSQHSCGLLDNGQVRCWGRNNINQLTVPAGITFTQIEAGNNHTCGLTSTGAVRCWGNMIDEKPGPYAQIAAGGNNTCALDADGNPTCWGGLTASGGPYNALAVGENFACGLKLDGSVSCWGGLNRVLTGPFEQISAGFDHACGILDNGRMQCWGGNSHGQAPVITIQPDTAILPTADVGSQFSTSSPLAQVTAQNGRSVTYNYSISAGALPPGLGLDSNNGLITGTLSQAGGYSFTVLAEEIGYTPAIAATRTYSVTVRGRVNASIDNILPSDHAVVGQPVQVAFSVHAQTGNDMGEKPTGAVRATAEGNECIVDLADGAGSCTMVFATPGEKTIFIEYPGDDLYLGGQTSITYPIHPFSQDPQIRTGTTRSYVHEPDGAVGCLGGTCESETLPGVFTRFGVGSNFACGLQFDENAKGEIVCRADEGAAAPQFEGGPYIDLSVGVNHACALKLDGKVECQGDDTHGQSTPPDISFASISAGGDRTCALDGSGKATCWGALDYAPAVPFKTLVLGDQHTCGLMDGGSVACWGNNTYGQCDAPDSPAAFAQITAGGHQTCGLDAEGHAFCWGNNDYGQSSPAYGHFVAIATADDHTCALRELEDGRYGFTCWGAAGDEAPQYPFHPFDIVSIPLDGEIDHIFMYPGEVEQLNTPVYANIVAGMLPPGVCMDEDCGPGTVVEPQSGYTPKNLSPGGMILSGRPTMPGKYEFLIRWVDSSPRYPMIMEMPYWLTVTGGDLAVRLEPETPGNAVETMAYTFTAEVSNQTQPAVPGGTVLPIPDVVLTIEIPPALTDIRDYPPVCELKEQKLTCDFGTIDQGESITVGVTGTVVRTGPVMEILSSVRSAQDTWPDIHPGDNTDLLSVPIDPDPNQKRVFLPMVINAK